MKPLSSAAVWATLGLLGALVIGAGQAQQAAALPSLPLPSVQPPAAQPPNAQQAAPPPAAVPAAPKPLPTRPDPYNLGLSSTSQKLQQLQQQLSAQKQLSAQQKAQLEQLRRNIASLSAQQQEVLGQIDTLEEPDRSAAQ